MGQMEVLDWLQRLIEKHPGMPIKWAWEWRGVTDSQIARGYKRAVEEANA